jgi:hypothetical protein
MPKCAVLLTVSRASKDAIDLPLIGAPAQWPSEAAYSSSSAIFTNRDHSAAMQMSLIRRLSDRPSLTLSRRHSASLSWHNWRFNSGGGKAVMRHGAPGASLESGPKSSQARIHAHAAQLRRPRANAAAIPWCPRPPVRHPKSSAAFRDDRPGTGKFECVRRFDRARRQCRLPAFVDRTGSPVIRCSPVLANDQTLTFETHPCTKP